MSFEILTKQKYTNINLINQLNFIQKNIINLCKEQIKITINIFDDNIYYKILEIYNHINENFIQNHYDGHTDYIVIYNNIIISIENNTYINYSINESYLTFLYNKNDINENDLIKLKDVFKFLIE